MEIKNIIFDLGGVILNIESDLTRQAFTNLGVPNINTLFAQGQEIELFTAYEVGKISSADFRKHLKGLLFIDHINDTDFDNAWNAMLLDLPGKNMQFVKNLSPHYRTFLFSNTNEIHLERFFNIVESCCGAPSLDDYFEREYYSCRMGLRKPHPASFQEILRQNNLKAEETLFIDDTFANIAGAKSVGLQTLHLQKPMELTQLNLTESLNTLS